MNKHQLTQDQIQVIAQCLSDGVEVPEHLLKLLSPSYFEKLFRDYQIDYQKLEKYKIPTIEYAGKRSEALILSQAGAMGGGSPLQVERCFENNSQKSSEESSSVSWKNLIVQGDNLQFLKTCYLNQDALIKDSVKEKVKLVYIDPPFATKSDFGGKEGESSYSDKVDRAEFIESLRERLIFLKELLHKDGSILVHIDFKMNHYVKVVLDEIFGKSNFINEIVWKRKFGNAAESNRLGAAYDNILLYSKTSNYTFNSVREKNSEHVQEYINSRFTRVEEDGKYAGERWMPYPLANPGDPTENLVYDYKGYSPPPKGWRMVKEKLSKLDEEGKLYFPEDKSQRLQEKKFLFEYEGQPVNSLWQDIFVINSQAKEALNYPTQKPEDLLARIIELSSNPGDLVLDCFAGSGTTGAVAEKLGRRWIMCDFGKHAIYTMQKRMLEIADSKKLGKDVKNGEKYGKHANPFCVASVGAYDFQRIMNLRENRSAYIDFVLSLFGITDRAKIENGEYSDELSIKFKLSNIYAKKDNNPVEVYPIWDDDFLKNIKIDQEYLEGIITQVGGNMRGKYYIIAPETCDVIGDTTIGEAEFIVLSYPYKILEEMSRNFQLAEQPSSEENINDLISSVRFYFNEDIEVGLERVDDGLKITRLLTPILDKDGNHFEGFEGLAMLLVDKDYDGTTFRMEEAIYAKHINEHGVCKIAGLSDKVAVIAIDKHGNESKLTIV